MRTLTIALLLLAACGSKKEKDKAKEETAGSGTGTGTGTGTGQTQTNSGSTSGSAASTQAGCVTKLPGAQMPQGDITLTEACGTVTVEGEVTIDAKLTIEPGVTVQFVENGVLYMGYGTAASLIAKGTAEKPIVFTSAGDKVAGWWKGIHAYSNFKRSTLDHVIIECAGSDGDEEGAGLRIDGLAKDVEITNSEFRLTKGWGIRADGEHVFTKIEGNKFHDLTVAALRIHPENLPELGANDYADRAVEILGDRSLSRSATLHAPGTYRLMGNVGVERSAANAGMPTLTIEPGVVVEAVSAAELHVGYGAAGTIKAEGTADKPITFTGFDKAKDSWNGIVLYDGAKDVSIKNAVIEYAKSEPEHGAIHVRNQGSVILENVTFRHLTGVGLGVDNGGKATVKDVKVDDAAGAEWRQPS